MSRSAYGNLGELDFGIYLDSALLCSNLHLAQEVPHIRYPFLYLGDVRAKSDGLDVDWERWIDAKSPWLPRASGGKLSDRGKGVRVGIVEQDEALLVLACVTVILL